MTESAPHETMNAPLHQITMTFSAEEDRMLLRIGTAEQSEYQMWLTRRFIKVLWSALIKVLEKDPDLRKDLLPDAREAVMAMQHQEALQTSDFGTTHAEGNRNLTSNTGPLLVVGGSVSPVNPELTRLSFNTDNGMAINFSLNQQLVHAFCHLIITTSVKAEWDLDLAVGDPAVVAADKSKVH